MHEIKPWAIGEVFLSLNPSGELPVLEVDGGPILRGVYAISEYFSEESSDNTSFNLFPGSLEQRAEVRRLVDWFNNKLAREVTRELLYEKFYARFVPKRHHTPNIRALTMARSSLRCHMRYIDHLAHQRLWLAGEHYSFADIVASAQLSSIDYLGEAPWEAYREAKLWYARIKSRPSFRTILSDRQPGVPAPSHYADLDF